MKRLIITGFGCPKSAWERLFPANEQQKIISFADVLRNCAASDLRSLAKSLIPTIEAFQPDVVILHDFGVVIGLFALLRLRKQQSDIKPKVVVFNGGFHYFNVFKARHPFAIQFLSFEKIAGHMNKVGGEIDPDLQPYLSRIKKIYRQVILASILSVITSILPGRKQQRFDVGNSMLVLASRNDPYIPLICLERIHQDFNGTTLFHMDYGHFPYSGDYVQIREKVFEFECL